MKRKRTPRAGCLQWLKVGGFLVLLAMIGNALGGNKENTAPSPATSITRTALTPRPTATTLPTEAVTAGQRLAAQSTAAATATTTATPTATATMLPNATMRWRMTATAANPSIWYVASAQRINVRAGASTDAEVIGQLNPGDQVPVYGQVTGGSVNGNTTWYEIEVQGRRAFVHSSLLSRTRPAAQPAHPVQNGPQQPPANTSGGGRSGSSAGPASGSTGFVCPRNCDGARAMGLSAEQAATCPRLDRDGDGVACYGD